MSSLPMALHHSSDAANRRREATGQSYQALVEASNPIAYYRLNDTGAVLTDSGPQHLNGTYGAGVAQAGTALTSGTGSQSAIFPGCAAGANVPQNTATVASVAPFAAATTTLTIEAWIQPRALNTSNRFVPIASFGREAQGQAWVLQVSPQSTLNFWMKTKNGSAPVAEVKGSTQLAPGKAYQVVATYDGTTARVYVNGTIDATSPASGMIDYSNITPTTALAIGGALGSNEPIFAGLISDVSI
jgi:hypothetical protein